jgi:hypothetical protein
MKVKSSCIYCKGYLSESSPRNMHWNCNHIYKTAISWDYFKKNWKQKEKSNLQGHIPKRKQKNVSMITGFMDRSDNTLNIKFEVDNKQLPNIDDRIMLADIILEQTNGYRNKLIKFQKTFKKNKINSNLLGK